MSIIKVLTEIKNYLKEIRDLIKGKNTDELMEIYLEYKFFADFRGLELLKEQGLVDEYNAFMEECEIALGLRPSSISKLSIELPKPSKELEEFKNKFKMFF